MQRKNHKAMRRWAWTVARASPVLRAAGRSVADGHFRPPSLDGCTSMPSKSSRRFDGGMTE